ncbi:hypothetical protein P168DRAFT_129728 [Aspergillus campestris IBT 28561]|uniref:Uncharacterized protein n=1 Tax=Aspergillus campestris (strain IBT 28561) TaxID=1392248 RepID=A0A2I1D757_ASPC2|nr:uncharacterized protein P168DRAFT_129728 [Aspergillus campestris IBT 28561]PKY05720.1 hypothetical protein P168DRAFT_129728 [Aspergillus campestris IBT 28561]
MASDNLVASDLRHGGTESKRFHDHKAKWAYGGRSASCRAHVTEGFVIARPAMPRTHFMNSTRALRFDRKAESNRIASTAKLALRGDISEALDSDSSGSSSGEEVDEPTAAQTLPVGAVDPFYSTSGQTLLSDAVSKAIEKFETKETEKLAKEYEMVVPEHESLARRVAVDGDFELVDRVEL